MAHRRCARFSTPVLRRREGDPDRNSPSRVLIIPVLIAVSWRNFPDVAIAPCHVAVPVLRLCGSAAICASPNGNILPGEFSLLATSDLTGRCFGTVVAGTVAVTPGTTSPLQKRYLQNEGCEPALGHFFVEIVIGIKYVCGRAVGPRSRVKTLRACRFWSHTNMTAAGCCLGCLT
jgi:hypothetical protein